MRTLRLFNLLTKYFLLSLLGIIPFSATYAQKDIAELKSKWETESKNLSTDSAIIYYKDLIDQSSKTNSNKKIIFELCISLGELYRIKADFAESLKYDLNALKIAEQIKNPVLLGRAHNNIGTDYYRTNMLSDAEKHFKDAIQYFSETDEESLQANSLYKLGMVYDDHGKIEEALEYYFDALLYFEDEGDCFGSADVYNGIASVYYKKGNQDSTEFYALRAMENYKECGSLETVSFMYMNLASLKNMQKQHAKALDYLKKGLQIADSLNFLSQQRQAYKNLSETYAYMGDYENAYKNQLKYNIYKDSIFNSENSAKFLELNTKYETEKKEKQIAKKQTEIELQKAEIEKSALQRNLLIIIAVLAAGFTVILIFRFNEKKKYAAILNGKNAELEKINSAKDKLFSIISHDLSSPVASYSRLTEALMNSVDKLSQDQLKEYLSELNSSSKNIQSLLANLLQWSLQQSGHFKPNPQVLNISELCNYTIKSLSAVADEKNVQIICYYESDAIIFADKKMIETALRNIISNAIKFSPENSEVVISTHKQTGWNMIKILDSGPGLDAEDIKKLFIPGEDLTLIGGKNKNKGTGLGLILAGEFVRMNKGEIFAEKNPKNSGLSITIKLKTT